ncbi:hypothetical protein JCM33374_g6120 [Metschnikowia sp. JCM 33374]|nr:hypothetical protein JCM33374_g6120 [Metschnikowia sp. JCM 33374]
MKLSLLTTFFELDLASRNLDFGTMQISIIDDQPIRNLIAVNDTVYAGHWMSVFQYDQRESTIKSLSSEKYMAVNEDGKLLMVDTPQPGFVIGDAVGWNDQGRLAYNGVRRFYVCDDDSVQYKGNCEGAQTISIFYKPLEVPE